jgi:tetratricopeptide (TPR) repeat protein
VNTQVIKQYQELHQNVFRKSKNEIIDKILPKDQDELRKKIATMLETKNEEQRIENGFNLIIETLHEYPDEKICRQELLEASKNLTEVFKFVSGHHKEMEDFLKEHAEDYSDETLSKTAGESEIFTLAAQVGISQSSIVTFYGIGTKLFNEKKYNDAISVFYLLSVLNPYTYEIWLSLGMSAHKIEEWGTAIHAYSMAAIFKPEQALPHLYAAECFVAIQDWEDAQVSLHSFENLMTREERNNYKTKIESLKSIL